MNVFPPRRLLNERNQKIAAIVAQIPIDPKAPITSSRSRPENTMQRATMGVMNDDHKTVTNTNTAPTTTNYECRKIIIENKQRKRFSHSRSDN